MMVNVLSIDQYLKMWNIIGNWQKTNRTTRLPNFVIVDGFKIMKSQFMDMWKRVKNYMDTHQGEYPHVVGIEGPAPENIADTPYLPAILTSAYKAVGGTFNTVTGAIERLKTEIYCNYNSDVFPQGQAMTRLLKGECLNCADFAQLLKAWIGALNLLGKRYQWRYVHIRCQSGAGHIILQVKGEELGDNWVDVDPAAAASNDAYKIGARWCQTGKIESFNDPWLMLDDGEF